LLDATTIVSSFERAEEATLMLAADVFVLPSFFEGQPLSLLQAMALGVACVTTNCCGQKDLIEDGESGLLVAPGDAEALAGAVEGLLVDSRLRDRLGLAARSRVEPLTWPAVSTRVAAQIEQWNGEFEYGRSAGR